MDAPTPPRPKLLSRYRLCEDQPVSVKIHRVEFHHSVILPAKLTGYFDSRHGRVLLIEPFHIVRYDVHIPRVAFASPCIVWREVPRLLLQEYLNVIPA